ncbi:multidrug efflux SMR transporter [Campylobacter sp. Cr9]|uniref:DMT family transporter n=1 Tax=unclassified Campylobacter TaxID=2593542 RepID=UPI001EFA9D88|nr:multidrug efflux SMR transporter [Campylobacter sp. RM5004]MBZ7986339.1 multidrug efflux SMR transporter [Campylobacter sp. Cr9]ULO01108.1 multidrug efflux system protein, EmrE family [Campylobacter sp. RM5004]
MAWIYLILAGVFEIGWPLGFKLANEGSKLWIIFAIFSMALSGFLLYLSQKSIPIGTAYIVWTGIGGIGTILVGIFFFQDSVSFLRLFFLALILVGLVGIKLVS